MVSNQLTTTSTQPAGILGRSQSHLDWNSPKESSTPRGEYAFLMDRCSPIWGINLHSSFGPIDGGAGMAVGQ